MEEKKRSAYMCVYSTIVSMGTRRENVGTVFITIWTKTRRASSRFYIYNSRPKSTILYEVS